MNISPVSIAPRKVPVGYVRVRFHGQRSHPAQQIDDA